MASRNAASREIVTTSPQETQGVGKTARRGPFALPLREVGHWTKGHRAARAAEHAERRELWEAASLAAFDSLHRTAPDPELVAIETETAPDSRPVGPERWATPADPHDLAVALLSPQNRPGAVEPGYDPAPLVTRRRVRWESFRNRKGKARRKRVTTKVQIEAHRAHASSAAWHNARSEGQKHRMAHVGACGVGRVSAMCSGCGAVHDSPAWCAVVRLCPGCNKRRAQKMQARFGVSLGVVLRAATRAGTLDPYRKGGRVTQKHLALTAPHEDIAPRSGAWGWARAHGWQLGEAVQGAWGWTRAEHGWAFRERGRLLWEKAVVASRARVMLGAWRDFSRELQRHLREPWESEKAELREGCTECEGTGKVWSEAGDRKKKCQACAYKAPIGSCWHKAFEWTPGEDGLGHPHLHVWMLVPWIPVTDEHEIASIGKGGKRVTTPCQAPNRIRGAWGWAETMRRERCPFCVAPATGGEEDRARHLDIYYRQARAQWFKQPAVPRRTGARTWWARALAKQGVYVDDRKVSLYLGAAHARPVVEITEIHKSGGVVFQREVTRRIEIEHEKGDRSVRYFEGWCVALEDSPPHILAGVYEALEGKRLSQSSKVALLSDSGRRRVFGLLGIADARYDASCQDCVSAHERHGWAAPPFRDKVVEVTTWKRIVAARVGPPLPQATAPPAEYLPSSGETYDALVARLRAEARSADAMSHLLDVCETIRSEGPSVLPVYRRTKPGRGAAPRDVRSLMKRRAVRR